MNLAEFHQKYGYEQSTVVMQQYLDLKFAHLDYLLLFQMGDFYELFFEDAILASKILGITLTRRGKIGEDAIAMCGVPVHALEHYLNKLLEAEQKVAICQQLETPEDARKRGGYKAIVRREVTRIITPGTITEDILVSTATPNYLTSVVTVKDKAAICYVDLSTSFIAVVELPLSEVVNELAKLASKEILLSDSLRAGALAEAIHKLLQPITFQVNSFFSTNKTLKIILDFYNISDISAIGEVSELQISAIGSILEYLSLTQKQHLNKLPFPKIVNYHHFMNIDIAARRNLELTVNLSGHVKGSVLGVIDHTITKAGSRLLYQFLSAPLTQIAAINDRLAIVDFFYNNLVITTKIRGLFKKVDDLERCLTRVIMGRSLPRDLLGIKNTLAVALEIKALFISNFSIKLADNIEHLTQFLSGDTELYELISQSILDTAPNSLSEGGIIRPEYHPRVAELYMLINDGKTHIDKLKIKYQQETGIENLKISHNNVIGLFIEITARHSNKITDEQFIHRQTTANAVRYTTVELQKLESDMVNARSLVVAFEQELYVKICQQVIDKSTIIARLAESLSALDVFCNLGYIADEYNYTKPEIVDDSSFVVNAGRHPVVERSQNINSKSFTHNDCVLSEQNRIQLLTGPNMSGKSTFLRQNAIITILAQIGSFVPASFAKIGIVDKIFSRIGSGDDLFKGQSTFMVEMLETSAILAQATSKSLIILDEVGRGTSTYDGVAIAWAVLEYVHDTLRCRCLFASHYHELIKLDKLLPALTNYTMDIEELGNEILFLHRIIPGHADKSYGVHVAQLAGLPSAVILRANEILQKFENISDKQEKKILNTESNNLSLFNFNNSAQEIKIAKYSKIVQELGSINPDNLSPKEALEVLYILRSMM
ncbi:DNA mismatch repair protein MutS [Candidatus Trichorickettsia mobilis]|uniref:DNA mismatch repair protein MutS n=2 Tax=Candidatus Trichorickettsia mobilis TaxID=1346319 RepID=A0ABZ0USF9_9RICK|nr:DNA mismatch repair protein MutS [Candidatus Trichorickettsia mobilis]